MRRAELPAPYQAVIPYDTLRPAQAKAVEAGVLDGKNILVCTPTASGKTLVAALASIRAKLAGTMGIYVAPLKALAGEKQRELQQYQLTTVLSVGDYDEAPEELAAADVVVTTPEKLDSLLRHSVPWLQRCGVLIVDEVHLLGDTSRGPTLEVLLTVLRSLLPTVQIVALSATVQNAQEIANWLDATLVADNWRPLPLRESIRLVDGTMLTK